MIYPRYYQFKTQTLRRTSDTQSTEADIAKTWELAQAAYTISPAFPPVVYTFYDEFIEFFSCENFFTFGFDFAARFLARQVTHNVAMKGGCVVFRVLDTVPGRDVGLGCLYFWKSRVSMLRLAKDAKRPYSFHDYIYHEGKYRTEHEEIDANVWLPRLTAQEKPIVSAKNKLGKDSEKLLNYFWRTAARAIKQEKHKPVLTPTITLVYNDVMDVFDLSPYVYSDLAGLGLASFIDDICCQPGVIASIFTLVEQENNEDHFLVLRYSTDDVHIIRSSKLIANALGSVNLAPFEESVAHAKPTQ